MAKYAIIKGKLEETDGWRLDPCELGENSSLPPCPDCGKSIGEYVPDRTTHTCCCGSEFDIWQERGLDGSHRLEACRAPYNDRGQPVND